jgi:hypothetical protein
MRGRVVVLSFVVVLVVVICLIFILGPATHTFFDGVHKVVVNTQTATNSPATVDSFLKALGGR